MPSTNTLGFHESHQGAIAESSASSVTFVEHYPSILAVPMPTVTPSPERWELPSIGDDIPNGMGLLGWADQKTADRKVQYGKSIESFGSQPANVCEDTHGMPKCMVPVRTEGSRTRMLSWARMVIEHLSKVCLSILDLDTNTITAINCVIR
ncbi:uncharacterized protein JN550_005285 [Neoarthrinium moseri]|uniref:uncharacterized protein n=1 Tax=Neoarthrinium moseri TaxID=1658444 RepID=UPI001FDD80E8|nr:uncharacterized protein JN550_005285 [Neoarthrinium moseri]KAI1870357.1 hypothetical protein JN550_005285 [Neoarthrinium moseri]